MWWQERAAAAGRRARLRGPHNRKRDGRGRGGAGARRRPDVEGLRTFRGVAHRLEEIATRDGVLYVNDSKATNVASTLVGWPPSRPAVHLILGGRGKGGGYAALRDAVAERVAPST